jgi:hypothetical protein
VAIGNYLCEPGSVLTPAQLGLIVKARRIALGRTQVEVVNAARDAFGTEVISEPTYRAVETGRTEATQLTLSAISRGLSWPADRLLTIKLGTELSPEFTEVDAATFVASFDHDDLVEAGVDIDASGADLDLLRRTDPEYFEQLMSLVRTHLRRQGHR